MNFIKQYKQILSWIPFTIFLIAMAAYSLSDYYGPYTKYWAYQNSNKKQIEVESTIGILEYNAYKDYFFQNSFNKYLNYKISSEVWISDSKIQVEQAAKESFLLSMDLFFNQNKSPKESIKSLIKVNTLNTFTRNFINSLNEKNIYTGMYQIDIHFSPQFEQSLNYDKELSTNNLISLRKLSLKKELEKEVPSVIQSVLHSKIPAIDRKYQYSGGTISILVNLEHTDSLGKVRFRRYLRANKLTNSDLKIESQNLKLNMLHLVPQNNSTHNYLTVDLYKDLSLDSDKSIKDRLELHFGKLIPSSPKDGKWIKSNFNKDKSLPITTGEFFLHGRYSSPYNSFIKNLKTKIKLEKLVYSFKDKKFTEDSKLHVMINERVPASIDKRQEVFLIKNIFKDNTAEHLIRELKLNKYIYNKNEHDREIH